MNKKIYPLALLSFFIFNLSFAQTISLSGKVLRHNGDPVEGVTIKCTNASDVMSAADGSFSFTDLPEGQNYTITGEFETDVFDDISVLDVAYTGDLILGTVDDPLNYQLLAADFNESGNVSTFDLVVMWRAVVKIASNFPDMYWEFLNGNTNSGIPAVGIHLQNVTEDMVDLELIAVKIGDVAIHTDHLPAPPEAPVTEYFIEDISVSQSEQFSLAVRVNDFKDIVGFQHGLHWDPGLLELVQVDGIEGLDFLSNELFNASGDLLVTGTSLISNIDLDNGSIVYTVKFNALQDLTGMEGVINFSDDLIPGQTVYRDTDSTLYLVEHVFAGVGTSTGNIAGLESFELFPNPAQNEMFVNIDFEQDQQAELSLYDFTGKLISSWNYNGHTFRKTIPLQVLPKGTYALKLRTDKGLLTKKFVKY